MKRGKVITFYSYKGGTGRTMALANVACLLAERKNCERGILMIDWDLEAPGLHHFFFPSEKHSVNFESSKFEQSPGLIDFWEKVDEILCASEENPQRDLEEQARAIFKNIDIRKYIQPIDLSIPYGKPSYGKLFLMKAGCFDQQYPGRVSRFRWEDLHKRSPWIYKIFAEELVQLFDYVLIDSRTGITDTSGICTMIMPEKLVVVFTPNNQSLTGIPDLIARALNYRLSSDDLRHLMFYPLPSRIDMTEPTQREAWRFGGKDDNMVGYQSLFESLFKDIYSLDDLSLNLYFDNVQIQYIPFYSYGEKIAVLLEKRGDRQSLTSSYEIFTNWLVDVSSPWNVSADISSSVNVILGSGAIAQGESAVAVGNSGVLIQGGYIHQQTGNRVAMGEAELKTYFFAMARECAELPLGIIDVEFAHKQGVLMQDVYIDLDVLGVKLERKKELHLLRRELEDLKESRENQRSALIEAIAGEEINRMVVLGAAGSGKTTFVNYLTYRLARAYADGAGVEDLPAGLRGLAPVRLVLRKVAWHVPLGAGRGKAEMLWNALREDLQARLGEGYGAAWEQLQKEMREGRSLVLLDGLDEVPEAGARRACLLQAVEDFLKGLPETQRVVLTARPYAYASPEWQLQGCEVFTLAPLSLEQVERFVERWYASVRRSVNLEAKEAQERAKQLATAIKARSYLGDLSSRPLLLTQMAMVHSTRKDLPEDRADLYEKTVDLLLVRWQHSGAGAALTVGEQVVQVDLTLIRSALAELAYQTHARQRGTKEMEGPGDIPFGDLLLVFVERLPKILPADLTAYLENRTGLLVEREPGLYCFAHRSFQEYLAACHLLDTADDRSDALRHLADEDPVWWREVILLALGKTHLGGMGAALELLRGALLPETLDECPNPGPGDWRAAVLGGIGLLELRVKERQPELAELPRNLPRARKWLVGVMRQSGLPACERGEAGNILAVLGDERFDSQHWYLPRDALLGFVRIPGGMFEMGSDPQRDRDMFQDEKPQHQVEVAEFYIQRYPVTVVQFQAFVECSRYKPVNHDNLKEVSNHPVRVVRWDDAWAYCRWLEGELRREGPHEIRSRLTQGWLLRLPTEAEWEKAARGVDGRIYPWGDAFDAERANTRESGLGETSPVGSFPGGASPYGIEELIGNVWEWTFSLYQKYPYLACDGREDPQSSGSRAVRGAAFDSDRTGARCACRYDEYFWDNTGFRVACVPPSTSEF